MKKHLKIVVLLILGIVSVIALGILLELYVIGEPVDGAQMVYTVSMNGDHLELRVEAAGSAVALCGWKHDQDHRTLRISARKVLVSPFYRESAYETVIHTAGIDRVLLGGREIWTSADGS